jgi:Arc/MetJ-type ribon-helix-helix transcriptional regulator
MHIELSNDVSDLVRELVVSGRFESEQAAIAEGLRLLKSREQLAAEVARGLKQLDDGDWVDGDVVFGELDREIDAIEKERLGG